MVTQNYTIENVEFILRLMSAHFFILNVSNVDNKTFFWILIFKIVACDNYWFFDYLHYKICEYIFDANE